MADWDVETMNTRIKNVFAELRAAFDAVPDSR